MPYSSEEVRTLVADNLLATNWDNEIATSTIISTLNSNLAGVSGNPNSFTLFVNNNLMTSKPATLDAFVTAFSNYWGLPTSSQPQIRTALVDTILTQLGFTTDIDGNIINNIAGLTDQPTAQGGLGASLVNDIIASGFSNFLKQIDYTIAPNATNFINAFKAYFVHFATVSTLSPDINLNFEEIYNAFFTANPTAFEQFLAQYVKETMYTTSDQGVTYNPDGTPFIPSEQLGNWLKKVQESYSLALYGSAQPTSSVGESFKKVVILEKILRLIIEMIGSLQQVAASQSDRLRILTKWQSAYTEVETQIPTFLQGDNLALRVGSGPDTLRARDQANAFNQTLTANIQSRRNIIQDDAKGVQSNLNQSNDSANQQANMGTAIIQQMSSLLSAIYR